jgi:hypothetical protein
MSRAGLGLAGYNLGIGGISLKLGSVAAVGLRGRLGRHLLFLPALKDEGPCSRAGVAGLLWQDAGERRHGDVFRIIH